MISASIAPAPPQKFPSCRNVNPRTPPSANTGTGLSRANRRHCKAPSPFCPGWLAEANNGERKIKSAPARAARRSSTPSCAEAVIQPCGLGMRRPAPRRRCQPAGAVGTASPATTSGIRRARHNRNTSRNVVWRAGSSSWRNTTPAISGGSRAITGSGSGNRRKSVKNHKVGCAQRRRRLTARASATNL